MYRSASVYRLIGRYRRSKQEITDIPNHGTSSTVYKFLVMNGAVFVLKKLGVQGCGSYG